MYVCMGVPFPQPAHGAAAGTGPAADLAPLAGASLVAPAAAGALVAPADAADIPVAGAGRGPAGRSPSLGSRGSPSGEVDARRDFIGSLRAQQGADPGEAGLGPAAQGPGKKC